VRITKKLVFEVLLGIVGLAVGIVGVLALREATLSTHETVTGRGTQLVVDADTKGGEEGQTLEEMVEAQLNTCRLEVSSDVVGELEALGDGRFRTTLEPTLDETNERQFRGCVEDWVIDHLKVDVVDLHSIPER
jgi:hypothetical protein